MLLGVEIGGMSTYTVSYTVDKDLMNGTVVQHSETPITDFAKIDLSNVFAANMLKVGKTAGLMADDFSNADNTALEDLINKMPIAKAVKDTATAVTPEALDKWLKQDPAFTALSKSVHPAVAGMTPEQVKALFFYKQI